MYFHALIDAIEIERDFERNVLFLFHDCYFLGSKLDSFHVHRQGDVVHTILFSPRYLIRLAGSFSFVS